MGYISDIRKFVGHEPILTAGVVLFIFNDKNPIIFFNAHIRLTRLSITEIDILSDEIPEQIKPKALRLCPLCKKKLYLS